jgi:DNA-binding GntR family transcriptional regulator
VASILDARQAPLTRNASAVAADLIRDAIADGRLEPGRRLKEEELARELGISRTPVREALLVLQTEGVLESAPNRGATVRAYEADDLDDLYQLRAVLEGFAARRAATRISAPDVTRLRESCERFVALRADADVAELVRENMLFHDVILDAASSERLTQMVRKVVQLPLVYRSYYWYSPEQKLISEHYHRQLTSAMAGRDAERAEIVMKEHVLEARDFLIAQFRAREAGKDGEEAA